MAAILRNNGLTELNIRDTEECTYVVWYDRHDALHDDPVQTVCWNGEELSLVVEDRDHGGTVILYESNDAFDRIDWLQSIRSNMIEALQEQGRRPCPVCGKPLKGRQRYCSDACRKTATPTPTVHEVIDTANRHIRALVSKLIEYEPRIHAGECPEGEYYEEKDCTGKSCALCRKRYYNKLKKKMLEKYSVGL